MCVLQMAQKQRQHSFELLTTNHISWFKFLLWVKSFPSGCPNHNPLMLGSFFFFWLFGFAFYTSSQFWTISLLRSVTILAELIFFVNAHVVLYFGFLMERVVIAYWYFGCCRAVLTQTQKLFSLLLCPATGELGVQKELRGHSQGSWPRMTRGRSHTIWCHAKQ